MRIGLPWSRFPETEHSDPARQARRRRYQWLAAGLALALIAGLWPARHWWTERLITQGIVRAEAHQQRQEWREAELLLTQNFATHPGDPRVLRALAHFQEVRGQREALVHRQALNRIDPANDADWIATATTAVQFGQWSLAHAALARVSPPARAGPVWQRTAAALALGEHDPAALIHALEILQRLDPSDRLVALNLQLTRLDDPDAATRDDARTQLARIARGPDNRITATLALLAAGRRADRPESFTQIARRLFPLRQFTEADAQDAVLVHMKAQPAPSVEEVLRLARYLAELGRAAEARDWLVLLPPALRETRAVVEVEAGLCADLADWPALHDVIGRGAWGGTTHAAIDAAFAAQAGEARGDPVKKLRQWHQALGLAESDARLGPVLVRLAVLWGWSQEARQALGLVTVRQALAPATLARLVRIAAAAGDSETLAEALGRWYILEPKYPGLEDRLIYVSALRGTLSVKQQDELAAEAPSAAPFRLAAQGLVALRTDRQPARLAALVDAPLAGNVPPEVRLVHGLLLRAAGRSAEAERQLESVRHEPLLPEERAMLAADQARAAR